MARLLIVALACLPGILFSSASIEAVSASPMMVNPVGPNTTTVSCLFNAGTLNVQDVAVTLVVYSLDLSTARTLCEAVQDGGSCAGANGNPLGVTDEGGNFYTAHVLWDPDDGMPIGDYDIECTLIEGSGNVTWAADGWPDLTLAGCLVYCEDIDGDTHGDPATAFESCANPGPPYTTDCTDCAEGNDAIPGPEVCDGVDNDCNGLEDDGTRWSNLGTACTTGTGACVSDGFWVCNASDPAGDTVCDAPPVAPAPDDATCDGVDDNCNGQPDEEYESDASCGVGYCRDNNMPSTCDNGFETLCVESSPLAAGDTTCDGVDDDCNGVTDDEGDTDCQALAGTCQAGTCSGGGCSFTPIPNCCITPTECPGAPPCVIGDCQANACVYTNPAGCCGAPEDCNDGSACTLDTCDESGTCQTEGVARCCNLDEQCADADNACTEDVCDGSTNRCKYKILCQSPDDPCGGAANCEVSGLSVERGALTPSRVDLRSGSAASILQLHLYADAFSVLIDGILFETEFPGQQGITLALYLDLLGNGEIAAGAQPLATAVVPLGARTVVLSPTSLYVPAAGRQSVLVAVSVPAAPAGTLAPRLPPHVLPALAALLAAAIVGALARPRLRRWRALALMVLLSGAGSLTCIYEIGKFDFSHEGRARLKEVAADTGSNQRAIRVSGTPLDSATFVIP